MSRSSGFINLTDWVIYQESGSANLSIISAGSSFNSYQYRCIINGTESCKMVPDTLQVANLPGSIAAQSHQVLMDAPLSIDDGVTQAEVNVIGTNKILAPNGKAEFRVENYILF